MNFQEMYSTSMLFGTQAFPNARYNVLFKKLLLRYKIRFSPLCFNESFDHIVFSSVSVLSHIMLSVYNVVGYEKLTNLDQLTPWTN